MTIHVLLVEDHRLVREALHQALARQDGIDIVGEAGTGAEALDEVQRLRPDVVVLDIRLPDFSGIEVASRLKQRDGNVRIVALSAYADSRFVREMLRAGAMAYVTKSSAGTELVHAVQAVSRGESHFCPEVATALARSMAADDDLGVARLGRREKEVLTLVAQGLRTPDIAQRLTIAPATVEVHRRNIMRKLELHTVAELTRYAVRQGLVLP